MPFIRVQVYLPSTTAGEGFDGSINTWHITTDGIATRDSALAGFIGDIETFYHAVDAHLSSVIDSATVNWAAYDLSEPEPRAPFDQDLITAFVPGTNALPPEVALCLSYRADYPSGSLRGRRRGRVYLGPMASAAASSTTGRPSTTVTDAVRDAAAQLLTDSQTDPNYSWVVFSPSDNFGRPVVGGWVDNSWDTQRRRGFDVTLTDEFGEGRT